MDVQLQNIINQGEGYYVEFKRNVNADIKKEMVAFANASGGSIYIGIEDNGSLSNLNITNELYSKIQTAADDCDPAIDIRINKITENVLQIVVKEGNNKPYRCTAGFYMRNSANTQKMRTDAIVDFIEKEGRVRFDEQMRIDADFKKYFSTKKWENFCDITGINKNNPVSTLMSFGVVKDLDNKLLFSNAGILFFVDNPSVFLPQNTVTCVLYKGTQKINIIDRKDFEDDLLTNITNAMQFVKRNINISAKIIGLQRQDIWEIPEVALREAIVNAVMHRDYLVKGARIVVEIFDDKIIISNPGGLPRGLSKNDFGKFSLSRNSIIASILLRAKYIEKLGTGIHRINNALKIAELPLANFEFDDFFRVSFVRATNKISSGESSVKGSVKGSGESSEKILAIISKNPKITTVLIAEQMGISTRAVEKHIANLKKLGKLKRIGSTKAGRWESVNINEDKNSSGESSVKGSVKGSGESSEKILVIISKNPKITTVLIAEQMGISTRAVEKHIANLKKQGKLKRIGSTKAGRWEITN